MPETKIKMCQVQITIKKRQNLPISNPEPDFHNNNANTKFGENTLIIYSSYCLEKKIMIRRGQITLDEICPLAIPKISTVLVKIH